MRICAAAVGTVFVVAGLSACSSGSDAETAATPSSADVCASADDLRGSLAALGDVQVAQEGTDALDQAWTTIQDDWASFADDARAQHADEVDGVQADVDSVQAAVDGARAAPNAGTLGTLASEVRTFVQDAGALVDEVQATC